MPSPAEQRTTLQQDVQFCKQQNRYVSANNRHKQRKLVGTKHYMKSRCEDITPRVSQIQNNYGFDQ